MSVWQRLHDWFSSPRRRLLREARRELDSLFSERKQLLIGTSLRPKHRGRTQVLDATRPPLCIYFGILRHPRPYGFSKQFHEVLELWCYDVEAQRVERIKGKNLTRERGEDGDPSAQGAGV